VLAECPREKRARERERERERERKRGEPSNGRGRRDRSRDGKMSIARGRILRERSSRQGTAGDQEARIL